jgi:quercetin dioxygenase-like cupin family protein
MTSTEGKRGISLFRATESTNLDQTDFMVPSEKSARPPEEVSEGAMAGLLTGGEVRVLVRNAGGFSLVHVWFKPNYRLPRHSHNADCMYYVISGSAVMGNRVLGPGDSFFVPADAPYQYNAGPEGVEVLEIRHGTEQFDMNVQPQTRDMWRRIFDAAEVNAEEWGRMTTSPTLSANPAR